METGIWSPAALRFLPLISKSPVKSEVFPAPSRAKSMWDFPAAAKSIAKSLGLPSSREVHREVHGLLVDCEVDGLPVDFAARPLSKRFPGGGGDRLRPCFNCLCYLWLGPSGSEHKVSQVCGREAGACCIGDIATSPQLP